MEEKKRLRSQLKAVRAALSEAERELFSRQICETLLSLPEYRSAGFCMVYQPFGTEADIRYILTEAQKDGKLILYPKVTGERTMLFTTGEEGFAAGAYGILEPVRNDPVCPQGKGLMLVPGLGFDRSGNRLGYGKGYYDAHIGQNDQVTYIGVCFHDQIIEKVPTESWDRQVDCIVSEKGVTSCKKDRK